MRSKLLAGLVALLLAGSAGQAAEEPDYPFLSMASSHDNLARCRAMKNWRDEWLCRFEEAIMCWPKGC